MPLVLNGTDGLSDVDGTAATPAIRGTDTNTGIFFPAADTIAFSEGGVESMRIDSSGNLLVGAAAVSSFSVSNGAMLLGTGRLLATHTNDAAINGSRLGSDGALCQWFRAGTLVGTITVTGSATAYNTSSDYRLKENIAPMTGALATVAALKPVTYKWKTDGSDGQGFIAHELQEVVPDCVTGEKDAVDAEGKPVYQGIDTSFLVATITAAIKELKATVDAQAARIAALEAK
jgi:hypothetical protein